MRAPDRSPKLWWLFHSRWQGVFVAVAVALTITGCSVEGLSGWSENKGSPAVKLVSSRDFATTPQRPMPDVVSEYVDESNFVAFETSAGKLEHMLAALQKAAKELRQSGSKTEAATLDELLATARAQLKTSSFPASDEIQLHHVNGGGDASIGQPRSNAVHVTATGTPIVLCLEAFGPGSWHIERDKNVKLKTIVVIGDSVQTFSGVPDVPVVHLKPVPGDINPVLDVCKHLNITPRSYCTNLNFLDANDGPLTVGPANKDWVAQQVIGNLEPAYKELLLRQRRSMIEQLRNVRFKALYQYKCFEPNYDDSSFFADWTVGGPLKQGSIDLKFSGVTNVVCIPGDKRLFGCGFGGFTAITNNGKDASDYNTIELPKVDGPNSNSGITWDAKRGSLVLNGGCANPVLGLYTPGAGSWRVIKLTGSADDLFELSGLCYSEREDLFYLLKVDHRFGGYRLCVFDPNGKMIAQRSTCLAFSGGGADPVQLIDCGEYLSAILPQHDSAGGVTNCVIRKSDAAVVLAAVTRPAGQH